MNILFLSDIHFGRELIAWGNFEKRAEIQEQLIHTVATLPENMKPDYIVVTGDIAWTGAEEEYEMAYDWFSQLLSATGLTGEKITFCAGNHDVNRKVAVRIPLSSLKNDDGIDLGEVDELYKRKQDSNERLKGFSNYEKLFDNSTGIISWHDDESIFEEGNVVNIIPGDEEFVLEFVPGVKCDAYDMIGIRFRNSGSSYDPFNIVFMRMICSCCKSSSYELDFFIKK